MMMMTSFEAALRASSIPHTSSVFTRAFLDDARYMRAPGGIPLLPA